MISLWLPRLATDRLSRRGRGRLPTSPREPAPPVVTVVTAADRLLIDAVDATAAAAGLQPGMPLADARALEPALIVHDAAPAADARALDDLADWCGRYTPWVAPERAIVHGAGGIWLDVTGCAHLFGGEAALLDALVARLAGFGYTARAAIADTPGAAWALARFASPGASARFAPGARAYVQPPDQARDALADLPVAGLRLAPATLDDLERFGLRRIGLLYDLARGPLVARFGGLLARRLDQALGVVREPISPRRPVPEARVRRGFAEPIATREAVTVAVRDLLAELCRDLARQGRGVRRLELAVWRLDGAVRRLPIGTHRATHAPDHLFRLLAEHLDKLDVDLGLEVMTLAATATEPLAPAQLALPAAGHSPSPPRGEGRGEGVSSPANRLHFAGKPPHVGRRPPHPNPLPGGEREGREPDLAPLFDRLTNRLGPKRVLRPVARPSHVPERAQSLLPLLEGAPPS
ncbi:MAG: DNA polymerase Y family protein, partial [Alphaproteobacteria bacterium]|nr:DNA polymerase Y family protein [Alphaproteobacteria bacterium]